MQLSVQIDAFLLVYIIFLIHASVMWILLILLHLS